MIIRIIISAAEDPSLRIESFATINLRGVSTKLNLVFFNKRLFKGPVDFCALSDNNNNFHTVCCNTI